MKSTNFPSAIVSLSILVFGLAGCGGGSSGPPSTRLIDRLDPDAFGQAVEKKIQPFATLPPSAWKAGPGVSGLAARDGKLVGRSTDPYPIIYAELPSWPDPDDTVDSVEVDLSITAGDLVQGTITGRDQPDNKTARYEVETDEPFLKTEIVAALGSQTVKMPFGGTKVLKDSRFLHISPTNTAGAEFEIETVRLITTRERLSATPSGIAWQGLSDIFRESIVSRSPEDFRVSIEVPENAWLDLHLGSLDPRPLTFTISLPEGATLLDQTVTTPKRWEAVDIDLERYAGQRLDLSFALSAGEEDVVGLWGGPTIRVRGARPETTEEAPAAFSAEPVRNVILIHADTLRRDHLPFHGYDRETAPFLAEMVRGGVVFNDSISPGSWTKVATPSIVTSLYPSTHTVANFPDRLPASAATIAEIYRKAGYATVCYSSVMFTGKFTNLHQGYDELHEFGSLRGGMPKSSREYVDRLTGWIDRHPETPFFAYLQVFDPHSPFEPRAPYNSLWADPSGRQAQLDRIKKLKDHTTEFFYRQQIAKGAEIEAAGVDPQALIDYHQDWYDGSIRGMDAELARLVARLRHHNLLERTLIVLFSDHGEEFLEHNGVFHGQSIYGDLTNVPLILSWPGALPEGVTVDQTVRSIDIMPTVLALSRLSTPATAQGQSLLPLIEAARKGGTPDEIEASAVEMGWRVEPAISENVTVGDDKLRATSFLSGPWKLIHNTFIPEGDDRPEYELFDHARDPLDLNDLAEHQSEVVERLKAELADWREEVKSSQLSPEDSTSGMTPQEIERLKSLGYVQ